MRPIAIAVRDDGEWRIVHRCRACGELRLNRIAGDDNPVALMSLALRPLAAPAAAAALGAVSAATPSRPTGSGPGASTTERGGHGVAGHRPTSE